MKNKSTWILLLVFFALLFGLNFYNNNLDKILCAKADFYYKNNSVDKALDFYEKAFQNGLNDFKKRTLFVDTIIKAPLNADYQEKLIRFLEIPIDDVAFIDAKYYLDGLRDEVQRKYPENYISNAVYNHQIMRWNTQPITYTFLSSRSFPPYFVNEINNAFKTWERATSQELQFLEDNTNPNIVIKFNQYNPADIDDEKYVVAYTVPSTELNKLKKMEIKFYLKDLQGNYFSQNQVYNTALHEIAHALGLMGHSSDRNNVMYLSQDPKNVLRDKREVPTIADINTLKLLYKIKPEITNIEKGKGDYTSSIVLGSSEDVYIEKVEEAITYIKNAPDLPAGYIDLAESYMLAKDYEKALKSLKQAKRYAETREMKAIVYYNLAVVYYHNKNFIDAKSYINASMAINNSEEKQYLLAEILLQLGNKKEAKKELENLVKKNPDNVEYVIALVNVYVQSFDYIRARSALKQYIKRHPKERNNPRFNSYGIIRFGL